MPWSQLKELIEAKAAGGEAFTVEEGSGSGKKSSAGKSGASSAKKTPAKKTPSKKSA